MNLGKYVFDSEKTKKLRDSLPTNVTGIVLSRRFDKVERMNHIIQIIFILYG